MLCIYFGHPIRGCSRPTYCSCLIVAFATKVFISFMHCLLVLTKFSLLRKLFVAIPARMFESFMYCPLVLSNIFFLICLMAALLADVFDSCMCPLMFSKIFSLRKFYITLYSMFFLYLKVLGPLFLLSSHFWPKFFWTKN